MIEDIRTIRVFKSIPIKVYEEIHISIHDQEDTSIRAMSKLINPNDFPDIEWVDNNGINTPYLISWI